MNFQDIISNLKAECEGCKVQKAIEALEALDHGGDKAHQSTQKAIRIGKTGLNRKKASSSSPGSDPKTRTEKACNKCGAVKKLAEYPTNKACADGHVGECKECARKRQRANYLRKHGKPLEQEADSLDPVVCKLCKSVCHGKARYERHMHAVHGMQAA